MKLLINTTSPYTRIASIALWEKGFRDVEAQIVDPWGDTPELLEVNTAARVPTLITDDGQILTESLLIVLWLESIRPKPSLLGDDAAGTLAPFTRSSAARTAANRSTNRRLACAGAAAWPRG
jgi:glutathione S-transferase